LTLSDEEQRPSLPGASSAGLERPNARELARLEALLNRREVATRLDIVRHFAATSQGARALRRRLSEERNPVVLSEICDALADLRARDSVPELERLAQTHPLQQVRGSALSALAALRGWESVPYLRRRLQSERSPAVRAVLCGLLFVTGSDEGLPLIRQALASRDGNVKRLVANTLLRHSPRRRRSLVIQALEEGLAEETREEVVADLERAISELAQGRPRPAADPGPC